ncbi:hypothetical protein MPLDJ20_260180 [Mesorhizobium plurifarium]|uniref:Uncharacterized protein n=1 Tax=Mesorhizobium plurifarium TaxID=69974 RepID=A0A090FEE8_MESPL|nr:hypothetical protein MPLDJ20_260180 [Mesorhizobium plurifarium]
MKRLSRNIIQRAPICYSPSVAINIQFRLIEGI